MDELLLKDHEKYIWGENKSCLEGNSKFFKMFQMAQIHLIRDPRAVLASWVISQIVAMIIGYGLELQVL